jgi:hypothetical protein
MLAAAEATLAAAAAIGASNPTETVQLRPLAGSGVTGTVTAGARGAGTHAVFALRGLKPNTPVRALMQAGTCARTGASLASAGGAKAGASGTARWSANVLFRAQPVAWRIVADGGHVFRIVAGGRAVACGVVPGMS